MVMLVCVCIPLQCERVSAVRPTEPIYSYQEIQQMLLQYPDTWKQYVTLQQLHHMYSIAGHTLMPPVA